MVLSDETTIVSYKSGVVDLPWCEDTEDGGAPTPPLKGARGYHGLWLDTLMPAGRFCAYFAIAVLALLALFYFVGFEAPSKGGGGGGGGGGDGPQPQRFFTVGFVPATGYDGPLAVSGSIEVAADRSTLTLEVDLEGVDYLTCGSSSARDGGGAALACGIRLHHGLQDGAASCDAVGPAVGGLTTASWADVAYVATADGKAYDTISVASEVDDVAALAVVIYDSEGDAIACSLFGEARTAPSVEPSPAPTIEAAPPTPSPTTKPFPLPTMMVSPPSPRPTAAGTPSTSVGTTSYAPTRKPTTSTPAGDDDDSELEPPTAPLGFVAEHGRLVVADGLIYGARSGEVVQVRGMSLFWSNTGWKGERFYTAGVVAAVAREWHATVIRCAMGVETEGGYLEDPAGNLDRVVRVVEAAIAEEIYVIIDWHTHEAEDYEAAAVAFFRSMARRFGSSAHVLFEVYNEPILTEWAVIKVYAERVIAAIREEGSANLVIVGSKSWSQEVDEAAANPLLDGNVAYALHFYAAQPEHQEPLRAKAEAALTLGAALFVTEWGSMQANGDGAIDTAATAEWLRFLDARAISSCNWAINDKAETASALVAGASGLGAWDYSRDLTRSGEIALDYILAATPEPTFVHGWPTGAPSFAPTAPTAAPSIAPPEPCCSWNACGECGVTTDYCAATASRCENDCGGTWCPAGGGVFTAEGHAYYSRSACDPTATAPNDAETAYAYACLDWSVGSEAMVEAADRAGMGATHAFGVGAFGGDAANMGKCYEVHLANPRAWTKTGLIQIINQGGNAEANEVSVQMGLGGLGVFQACAPGTASGGPAMFADATLADFGLRYGGVRDRADCNAGTPDWPTALLDEDDKDSLPDLCKASFDLGLREADGVNPPVARTNRVPCPPQLVAVTGLRRVDDDWNFDDETNDSPGALARVMDCCKPSAGWLGNAPNGDPKFPAVVSCTVDGYTRLPTT